MENQTNGGCGNDFTMDDITFRECYSVLPVTQQKEEKIMEQKPVSKPEPVVLKPVVKEPVPDRSWRKQAEVKKMPVEEKTVDPKLTVKTAPVNIPLPQVILSPRKPCC